MVAIVRGKRAIIFSILGLGRAPDSEILIQSPWFDDLGGET